MKRFLISLLATAMIFSCGTEESVTVKTQDGTLVRVTATGDNIFRVTAVPPGAEFHSQQSLVTVPQSGSPKVEVKRNGESTVISTPRLSATIDNASGAVTFSDLEGNVILSENRREFTPIEVDGTEGWTVRQVFDSADDEGFFGLGQHQADEWNYKGRNEELYQYNTKISVPFVVSSRNYGILWDSYSFCRWGDPRGYSDLGDVFRLYDRDGVEGALTGTYSPAQGENLVRRETALAQEYLETPDCVSVRNAPQGFNFKGAKVIYEGEIEPSESGLFHFYLYYAGYTKVYLDGVQVMPEIWRTAWNPNGRKFEANLQKGVRTPLRIEWIPDGNVSYCALKALSPVDPSEQARMSWWGEMQDGIDYYFIKGDNADGVISGYRTLTGKAPVMPKWALGYWQSRERYSTQDQIVGVLKEFRDRNIPIDNIVQDWQYWKDDQWGSHEFDPDRYPDPEGMIDRIHAMNGRFMISVWPKFYAGTEHFKELDDNGWIYQTAIRDSVEDWLGYQQSFYDAYSEGARKMFWDQMWSTLPHSIDAWWMDASEPNIHDCTDMDYRKEMCGPTALGPSTKYFNAYALMNAKAIYEGQRAADPDRRVFLLTRNGFAGLQRYSTASWSGDIGTRWEDMKAQISAGLNYSISGIPFWGQDIGGFSVEDRYFKAQQIFDETGVENEDLKEWRELNVRWHQWGIFCPLYRSHGQFPLREPWNIAPEGSQPYEAIVSCDRMRYRLMPYIYSMTARVHFDDYTIMRPLVMDFNDSKAMNISDEYMFGDALLICPVCRYGARSREVYLPEGASWYDINDNMKLHEGGSSFEAAAPYNAIPVFAKSGTIVPSGPVIMSTAETPDELFLTVFTGDDASTELYEDDGLSYGYERGEYSTIPMKWDEASRTLTIGRRNGSFSGMPGSRKITARAVCDGTVKEAGATYDGNEITVRFD